MDTPYRLPNGQRVLPPGQILSSNDSRPVWKIKLDLARKYHERLNGWQQVFVRSPLWDRIEMPTAKQYAKIHEIWEFLLQKNLAAEDRCWDNRAFDDVYSYDHEMQD